VRVLFTETDEAMIALLRALLEGDGHAAVRAPTMPEAARLAGPWDVVLVSGLPNSWRELDADDGAELGALASLAPVVLLAERAWMGNVRPADLGVVAIVRKPFEIDELLDAVRAAGAGCGRPTNGVAARAARGTTRRPRRGAPTGSRGSGPPRRPPSPRSR
jgi:DNA-binding response OmpR family regulator